MISISTIVKAFCLLCLILACENAPTNTTARLLALRDTMRTMGYDAVIIPTDDEHQSEYVSDYHNRRQWISGFTGSAGTAVVTLDKAALWTDSRYFLSAEKELDSNWILQKSGLAGVPIIDNWLKSVLAPWKKVALNAQLSSISGWQARATRLSEGNLTLEDPGKDLVDQVWTNQTGRPPFPNSQLHIHTLDFAGLSWEEKVGEAINRTKAAGADVLVVTALDEIAWVFNLRASDVSYNPVFYSYAILNSDGKHKLYIDTNRITTEIKNHLNGVTIDKYENVFQDIKTLSNSGKTIFVSPASSYAIYSAVTNKDKLVNSKASPVKLMKGIKNSVEIKHIRECQIRDSAYRVRHMRWLEEQLNKGETVTEISAAVELEKMQAVDPNFRGLSFETISAVGPHASIIHFSPTKEEDIPLTKDSMYLLDAGAQFDGCTTDITRTHHFGTPKPLEILAYTKVLQGSIDLANLVFPEGSITYRTIDSLARAPLWQAGLDYGHGTGHGIGYYLNVHEDPPYSSETFDLPHAIGMVQSDEPGYYQDNEFGIRLETDLEVVKANTPYNFRDLTYLKFDALSLVPFDKNLIDIKLLTEPQIEWLNQYNLRIRETVGKFLKDKNDMDTYNYLLTKTEPFSTTETITTTSSPMQGTTTSPPTQGTTTSPSNQETTTSKNKANGLAPSTIILLLIFVVKLFHL